MQESSDEEGDSGLSVPQDLRVLPGPSAPPWTPGPPTPAGSPGLPEHAVPPGPPRRLRQERTVYNKEQQSQLEKEYQMTKYPTYEAHSALAERFGLQVHQIQVWFKNRRAKESRQQLQQLVQPLPGRRSSRAFYARRYSGPYGYVPAPSCCGPVFPPTPHFHGLALPSASSFAFSSYSWAWPQDPHSPDIKPDIASLPYHREHSPPEPIEEPLFPAMTPVCPVGDGPVDKDTPGSGDY